MLHKSTGAFDIEFSKDNLIGYLTTQSNIEQAVQDNQNYEDIEDYLKNELKDFVFDTPFKYGYTAEIFQFFGN